MEAYGRRSKLRYNYVDHHMVGYTNWWKHELSSYSKKRARRNSRKEIEEEIMSINIVDEEGTPIIRLDETDSKKDVVIQNGKEILLSDAIKNAKHED